MQANSLQDVAGLMQRLENIERRERIWRVVAAFQIVLLCGIAALAFARSTVEAKGNDILHARGLIIEDAQGRARILLVAPFPTSKDRLRQDATTEALLFLDDKGHDRLTVGEGLAPQIEGKVDPKFHRIGTTFGVMLHNTEGDERGGYNWLSNGRGVMTLDRPNAEALGAFVDDKSGRAGMVFDYPGGISEDASAIEITTKGDKGTISFRNSKDRERASLAIDNGIVTASGISVEQLHAK